MPPGVGYGPISSAAAKIRPPKRGNAASDIAQLGVAVLDRRDERRERAAAEQQQAELLRIQQEQLGLARQSQQVENDRLQLALDEQGRLVREREELLAGKPGLVDRVTRLHDNLGQQVDRSQLEAMTPQQLETLAQELRLESMERLRIRYQTNLERERINAEMRLNLREQINAMEVDISAHRRAREQVQKELVGVNLDISRLARSMNEQRKQQGLPELTDTQAKQLAYEELFNRRISELGFDPAALQLLETQKTQLQNELRGLYGGGSLNNVGSPDTTQPVQTSRFNDASPQEQAQLREMFLESYLGGTMSQQAIDRFQMDLGAPVGAWITEAEEQRALAQQTMPLSPEQAAAGITQRATMPADAAAVAPAVAPAPAAPAAPTPAQSIAPQAGRSAPLLNLPMPAAVPDPILQRFESVTSLRRRGNTSPQLRPPQLPWLRPPYQP